MVETRTGTADPHRAAGPGTRVRVRVRDHLASGHRTNAWLESLKSHSDVLSNAGSLIGTTAVTSLLGFVFWWVAARLFPMAAVGYGSAAVSAMTLLGTLGMLGLNTALVGELPKRPPHAGGLVAAALLVSGAASGILGLGFALIAPHVRGDVAPFIDGPLRVAFFTFAVAITGAILVLDQAFIGLLRSDLQLWRNATFAVAKLVVLVGIALVVHDRFGIGIFAAWAVGTAVSVIVPMVFLRRSGYRILHAPQWMVLRSLSRSAAEHNWLNMALQTPRLALPILVTAQLSPTAGASFYAAWMIVIIAYMLPSNLTTVLYAISSADRRLLRRKTRFTMRTSLIVGAIGVFILIACAGPAMDLFGKGYEQAITPLRILALSYLPMVVKTHYVAICRVRGWRVRAAWVATGGTALELAAAAVGGQIAGLTGLSIGLFGAMCVEALVVAPTVAGVMTRSPRSPGQHRVSA
ncbi:MAG: lipopolysaccharide biosynthesis protein [Streptosporangiaceae bacterium]